MLPPGGVEVGWGLSHIVATTDLEPWHPWGARGPWWTDGRALLENRVVSPLPDTGPHSGRAAGSVEPDLSCQAPGPPPHSPALISQPQRRLGLLPWGSVGICGNTKGAFI